MEVQLHRNKTISRYVRRREEQGKHLFALCGGRRSGKTFWVSQEMLLNALKGDICNVASMTSEQGRLGAYADHKTILSSTGLAPWFEVLSSPREIRALNGRNGKIFFNSYSDSETAKGIACDWLFVNEANNFTKQQITDLMANVRKGAYFDYNPMLDYKDWWISEYFEEDEICHTTWQDNKSHLTELQLEYFENLRRLGEGPDANPVNRRNYLIYYCGEYGELEGQIFTRDNLRRVSAEQIPWDRLHNFVIFSDPSALRGADWFASVLTASDRETGEVYFLDAFSTNVGDRCDILERYKRWGAKYQVELTYVETNGYVGIDFYEYAINSEFPVTGWCSKGNKFERIVANFQNITTQCWFADTPEMDEYLKQCYDFDKKCEHDDNIDAINSAYNAHKLL